jgi:lipid-A-disaccharide synthase
MAEAGVKILERAESLAAMGLAEIVGSIPVHVRLLLRLRRLFRSGRYQLVILVDYPGFHLKVAAAARAAGLPVLYYIAPQLWAWAEWRVRSLRKNVSSLAVILPFEERFFAARGIPAEFVGHPLLDRWAPPPRIAARSEMSIDNGAPLLALFPGSRPQEVERLWPAFRDAAKRLQHVMPALQVAVAAVSGARYPGADGFVLAHRGAQHLFAAADVGLCKSGTTTMEAMLANLPMVIAYRMHPLTHAIARRAVRLTHVGLVNLIAERDVVPEFIQDSVTPEILANALQPLLDPAGMAARRQREAFREIRDKLGVPGAGKRVAAMALRLVA